MKILYQQPVTQTIELSTRSGVLIGASNERYKEEIFDPGFAPRPNPR